MARFDIAGFFWNDTPPPKPPKKEKIKNTPPEPVWLLPTYLPGLEEAKAAKFDFFTDQELVEAAGRKERLVWDIECYPNFWMVAFQSIVSGKVIWFELMDNYYLDIPKLAWVLQNFTLIDYNGKHYDAPIVSLALSSKTTEQLYEATFSIIIEEARPQDVLRRFKVKRFPIDHIDLIELVALSPSLKLLAGRLHAKRMQDLPFAPGTILTPDQITILRWYCINDLSNTKLLYEELLPDIELREKMGIRYKLDLRSHSDAQIAEAVISSEIKRMTGQKYLPKPDINPGDSFKFNTPAFLNFKTPLLKWVLQEVQNCNFVVSDDGNIGMPAELTDLRIKIANAEYRMGIGGLHSSEKVAAHVSDENTVICDRDVASFYPRIILLLGLAPAHLGQYFLAVYDNLVNERLTAKNAGNKTTADSLKIVVNGSYGKLGNQYSALYSPQLLIQVTLTGQLSLLMLIESLELAGLQIISANTDGIVIKCPKTRQFEMDAIVEAWEKDTGFETEATFYKGVYSRDVNNYFAVKTKAGKPDAKYLEDRLGIKAKGVYAERGSSRNSILSKNPMCSICSDAVVKMLAENTPILETIKQCRDITRFVSVRTVRGGAVKNGVYLGKAIRWYYAAGEEGVIIYAKSGNTVPRSLGAKPLMVLPDTFPEDIDYKWYEDEANKILVQIGFLKGEVEINEEE